MAANNRLRAARVVLGLTQQSEQNTKTNVPAKTPQPAGKGQTPDLERWINAGWLRLWKAVYPNTPPPTEVQRLESEVQSPRSKVGVGAGSDFRLETYD